MHRSENAANYLRGDEGLDLLYAYRPAAWRLLADATERDTAMGRLRVISAEGLIPLKTTSESLREPLAGTDVLDIAQVGNGDLSDWLELMEVVEALCPVWPARERTMGGGYVL